MPASTAKRLCVLLAAYLLGGSAALQAAPPVDVVVVDLAPLIDQAASSHTRFAVDVAHAVSLTTSGEWSRTDDVSTWTYSVQIPGAVSMSFHATDALLPPNATLAISADGTDYVYTANDVRGGEFWSRLGRGDLLTFTLRVATADAARVRLEIGSFQAGYRSLGDDTRSNAYYDGLRKRALATPPAACAQNWTCNVTTTNAGPGNATAAIIISNTNLCTGVLLNDVPGDGTPYLLTARHCQNGSSDGGLPSAAASIVVYWNAVSACGSPLGSVFDASTVVQYGGADTVVEQQDTWLVRLRQPPIVDAYYAGWDATGGTFVGGFTPHHASGTSRQFVGWYGQAVYFTQSAASLNVKYTSTFWGTVNSLGAGGPGSSGGGLFNDTGHVVGTVVRGIEAADGSGICPTNPPAVPTQASATALSTAFSGVFSSTADPGSSTGSATLQSVLDPANTGTLVVEGTGSPITVTLQSYYSSSVQTGTQVPLEWSASSNAVSCTRSGGETGDGWPGAASINGSKQVTSFDGGDITYTITCTDGGQRTGSANITLHWTLGDPAVWLSSSYYVDYGAPFTVDWSSNVRPCTASGGGTGDGWSGSVAPRGTTSITETVVGSITYTLTCGSGTRIASAQFTTNVLAPSVSVQADAATLRLGETVNIVAYPRGGPCSKTGGRAGDGWAGSVPVNSQTVAVTLTETVAGTYTYSVACGSGSYVATAQVTVTFRDDPPHVAVGVSPNTAPINTGTINITWDSNVRECTRTITGPTGSGPALSVPPGGSVGFTANVIGQYVVDVTCGSGANVAHGSATMSWTGTPAVRLNAPTSAAGGAPFNIDYFANVAPCTMSGGTTGDYWAGQRNESFGTLQIIEQNAGTQTYIVTCGSGAETATERVSVTIVGDAPHVTLTSDRAQQVFGQPITLTWRSNTSTCNALDFSNTGDVWNGPLPGSGSKTFTENGGGSHSFEIFCYTGSAAAHAVVTVAFAPGVTLTADVSTVAPAQAITLTWTTSGANACYASGGSFGNSSAGILSAQGGSRTLSEANEGTYVYAIRCDGGGVTASASVTVTVSRSAAPPAGGGGGGGGSMGPADLAFFAALGLLGYWQRRRDRPAANSHHTQRFLSH